MFSCYQRDLLRNTCLDDEKVVVFVIFGCMCCGVNKMISVLTSLPCIIWMKS